MAVPMNSTQFRVIVEPIMNEHFDGVYSQRKDEYKQIFTTKPGTPRAYHEEPVMFGLGSAPQMPDGTGVQYKQGGVLFNKRYIYKQYGAAFAMTKVLVEDGDHINLGKIYSEQLGQAMVETEETATANVLNFSFTNSSPYLGGDGVSLVNSSHPIMGGVMSNVLPTPAALSQTSVEALLIQIRKSMDNDQKRVRINPLCLVVSPDNEFQAEVITKSALRTSSTSAGPGSATYAVNDINPIMSLKILPKGLVDQYRRTHGPAVPDAPHGAEEHGRRFRDRQHALQGHQPLGYKLDELPHRLRYTGTVKRSCALPRADSGAVSQGQQSP
jgi:hypothetical protein